MRPRVLRGMEAVLGFVRQSHARHAEQRRAGETHRGEPLRGSDPLRRALDAGNRGPRSRGNRGARRARQLVSDAEHADPSVCRADRQ